MPPSDVDRGWAWVVAFGGALTMFLTAGLPWAAAGTYNVIFLRAFPESSAAKVAVATSLTTSVTFGAGPVAGFLVSKYGLRLPTILGGIIAAVGFSCSMFATSVDVLIFSFGIITGVGLGIAHVSGCSALPYFFDRYLGFATALAFCGTGIGTMLSAPGITWLEHNFGWRGSLLIVGGFTLHLLVSAFIFRPNSRAWNRKNTASAIDLDLFRNFRFILLTLNGFLVSFGLSTFFVHIISFATSRGHTDTEGAMALSAEGFAGLVGRLVLPPLTKLPRVNVCLFYSMCYIAMGLCLIICPWIGHSYIAIVIFSAIFGFFSTAFGAIFIVLLVELFGIDRFANSFGYLSIFHAIGFACGGPVTAALLDVTGTYDASLYTGGGTLLLGGIIPIFSLFGKKSNAATTQNSVTKEQSLEVKTNMVDT